MNTARETIYSTLFALLSSTSPFVTTGRRVKLMNELQPSAMPALYQVQVGEDTVQVRGIPPKYTLHVDIVLYASNPDQTVPATTQLNGLIDAIERALAPSPVNNVQSLGGLVDHCFISGKTEVFEGSQGNTAGAVIPIQIVTT